MAKKTTLPASTTKKPTPPKPASAGGRTPPTSRGSGTPPWVTKAAKKGGAVQRTPRKAGGK